MDNWFSDIESKVFTYISYYMGKKHSNLECTTKAFNIEPTSFPSMYLHELPSVEIGQTLENADICGILSTIEIQMFTDTSETDCKELLSEAISLMKSLRYSVIALPDVSTNNNIAFGVARFRRAIGSEDKLY